MKTFVAPGLVACVAVAFALRPLDDFDVWYHLAAARLMLSTWSWPATNTFAFTTPDHPWIDLHWIFQLLLYGAWGLAGADGCVVLVAILALATAGILYADARRFVVPSVAACLVAVALVVASSRFVPRPEMLSFVLFAAYLWLLDGYPRNGRAIYLLVPLQILWINVQGIFIVGLGLIAFYWLGATLALLPLPRRWREASGGTPAEWRRLTLVLGLATVGCLLNPYGVRGLLFPLELLPRVTGESLLSSRIGEFRAPLASGYAPPLAYTWVALLVATGLSFVANARRWHLGRLLAAAAFGYLSTRALRNMALFAWIAVPAIAGNLGALVEQRRARASTAATRAARRSGARQPLRAPWASHVGAATVTLGLVVLLASVVTNRFSRAVGTRTAFGLGVSRLRVPVAALDFADRVGIGGRPFNCLASGGYLAWRRFPGERIFVDGRLEAYPESFFRTYFAALDDPGTWPGVASGERVDYVLLYHVWPNRHALARYLASGNGWTIVYYDENASIFLPTDEAHREMRERAQRAFVELRAARRAAPAEPVSWWRAVAPPLEEIELQQTYGDYLQALGVPGEAAEAYKRALVLAPDDSTIRFGLGLAYWYAGARSQAVREWRDTVRRDPSFRRAQDALAEAAAAGVGAASEGS